MVASLVLQYNPDSSIGIKLRDGPGSVKKVNWVQNLHGCPLSARVEGGK